MSDTINITVNPDGDEVTIAIDDSAGAAVFAAAAEASAIAAAGYEEDAAQSKIDAAEQAGIATTQANLAITNGLFVSADNLIITYNANGTVNTVSNGTITKTIGYTNGLATSVT